jgi:hypothetical protein
VSTGRALAEIARCWLSQCASQSFTQPPAKCVFDILSPEFCCTALFEVFHADLRSGMAVACWSMIPLCMARVDVMSAIFLVELYRTS